MTTSIPSISSRLTLAMAVLVLAGCDSGSGPQREPSTIVITPGTLTFDALQDSRSLEAEVRDQNGDPMPEVDVDWSSSNPSVAHVSQAGVVTSTGDGSAIISAEAESLSRSIAVSVLQQPAAIEVLAGDNQEGIVGKVLPTPLRFRLRDRTGQPVASRGISFTVLSGGGSVTPSPATTDAAGIAVASWRLGPVADIPQTVLASVVGAASLSVELHAIGRPLVVGPPAALEKVSGDSQTGPPGSTLPFPIVVRVTDGSENPVGGVSVAFTPDAGSGTAAPMSAVSDDEGLAQTTWTLGGVTGQQRLTATIAGAAAVFTATASASGGAGFHIGYNFVGGASAEVQDAFEDAAARWAQIIVAKLPDATLTVPANSACQNPEALTATFDDVYIFVSIQNIDGPGIALAQAGPCFVREDSQLPIVGRVRIDASDVNSLITSGRLDEVVLHEVAHVLGFGTRWNAFGLLHNPSLQTTGADTYFSGQRAITAFNAIGGSTYTLGQKVPVENTLGGAGTRDSHWRNSVFGGEVMVGFINSSGLALSRVTAASLGDLGYTVNEGAADPYTLPGAGALGGPEESMVPDGTWIPIGDDVLRIPVVVVSPDGRTIRVVEPADPAAVP